MKTEGRNAVIELLKTGKNIDQLLIEKGEKIGTYFCDGKYSIAMCYRELGRFKEAYDIYFEIADIHRKNGYDVEAEQALGYAREIKDKI